MSKLVHLTHPDADQMILDCGHKPSLHSEHTTGYGKTADGKTHCWQCCAEQDKAQMIKDGRTVLYLTHGDFQSRYADGSVSNWPGSLKFSARVKRGMHNIARHRYDVWFKGPDGKLWHGVQIGDNTQLCHCKRTKGKI